MSRYNNNNNNNNTRNYDQRDQRGYGGNAERYIPRERDEERYDRRRDDRPREEPVTHPSICIPRTFTSIRGKPIKAAVFTTMRDLKVGFIERIDVIHKTDARGERYCTIYIHLKWNMNDTLACETRQKLLDGNDVKIVYDDPWFWKCTMSTMEKPDREGGDGGRSAPRPRIDLGDGVKAMSRYSRDEQPRGGAAAAAATQEYEEQEHHDQRQLCNMDPNEESDDN
jgi:hypothetical protein